MSEVNKQIVRRWVDLLRARDPNPFQVWAEDFALHSPPGFGTAHSVEEVRQRLSVFVGGFPDSQVVIKDLVAEGDRVFAWFSTTGTHTGKFMGIAPTGKRVEMWVMGLFRIADGKIAEEWVIDDYAAVLSQLDALPS
jgi:steroid delta-isomerase-like uncharacterized protein